MHAFEMNDLHSSVNTTQKVFITNLIYLSNFFFSLFLQLITSAVITLFFFFCKHLFVMYLINNPINNLFSNLCVDVSVSLFSEA